MQLRFVGQVRPNRAAGDVDRDADSLEVLEQLLPGPRPLLGSRTQLLDMSGSIR
ncbi:hypothetical protein ACHMWU_19595 [Aeromicrobium sp. UC242_57]